jgi:hypothetical protein
LQQIVIAGEQVPVQAFENAQMYAKFSGPDMMGMLQSVGYDDEQAAQESARALQEQGYDMPQAWTQVRKEDLIEIGIGGGYVPGVISVFRKRCVEVCGVAFVRQMDGAVKTDQQRAEKLLESKHAPEFPQVSVLTGYAPTPEELDGWMARMIGWVRPMDSLLADALWQLKDNYDVDPIALAVPYGNVRSLAVGTVMRGRIGFQGAEKLVDQDVLNRG